MKEEEKLLKVNLTNEQEKESVNKLTGYKLYFFRALFSIEKYQSNNQFCDILFTIIEFVQLMAFPMEEIFKIGWGDCWFGTVGNFFRFFQFFYLWKGNTPFYIISYIITCLFIFFFLIFSIHTLVKSRQYNLHNKIIVLCLCTQIQFETILNIPFLRILFSMFTCNNGVIEVAPDIKCHSITQISLIVISIIFIIIFKFLIIIFHSTLFEFGANSSKFKAAYTSSTNIILDVSKLLLVLLYQFVTNHTALAIIAFIISLLLLFHFVSTQPFSSGFTMKLYTTLYLFFLWSSILCLISIFLEKTKFDGAVILYLIGFPIIIFAVFFKDWDYAFDKIFEFMTISDREGYKKLLEIEYFLRFEDNLSEKIKTKQQKILYSYINNYERNCSIVDCPLKNFIKTPLKVENFVEMKIYLLQHAESLYKSAISKHPYNPKLRISYGIFLFHKMNKKLKGISEIVLLDKLNTNLEDSFLAYKAHRLLKDEESGELTLNEHDEQETNFIDSLTYKSILNSIKSLIGKITINYIDFWTMLAISDGNKVKNFLRMSKIGTRIRILSEELSEHIKKLETINIYDQETFKLYMQYLNEILSDNTQANIYHNKLNESDQNRHQYNEENLFELNYKEMSKREDYKYIIISFSPLNFNIISNVSYSACKTFGYTKEELIGRPFDILLPENLCQDHRRIFEEKIEEFKKKLLLVKNVKVRSDSWIDSSFSKNKLKYIIPFRARWTLVLSEDEIIYGIGNIISDGINLNQVEREIIYVLTDKNLIIQGFTPNAPKFLCLYSSSINSNINIIDYIRELSDDYTNAIESNVEDKDSNIPIHGGPNIHKKHKNLKLDILKTHFFTKKNTRKIIHWKFSEVVLHKLLKGNSSNNPRLSFINANEHQRSRSTFQDLRVKNAAKRVSWKKKFSLGSINSLDYDSNDPKKSFLSDKINLTNLLESDKFKNLKIIDTINAIEVGGTIIDDKILKILYSRPVHHKYYLSVKEAKIHGHKIGYIFRFEQPNYKHIDSRLSSKKFDLTALNMKENPDIEKSDISVVSFAGVGSEKKNVIITPSPDNPFGINDEGGDDFFKKINTEKEYQFTLDMNDMSYKQFGSIKKENKLFETLRNEAIEKINKTNQQLKRDEQEEEEESSSSGSSFSVEEENLSDSDISSKKRNNEISLNESKFNMQENENKANMKKDNLSTDNNNISSNKGNIPRSSYINMDQTNNSQNKNNNFNNTNNNTQHHLTHTHTKMKEDDDFYHVDMSKITLCIFNYQSGFVEIMKDPKYKISQVTKTMNQEKENAGKSTKLFASTKLGKEKKKGNIIKKTVNDDEDNSFSEKTIKLKEIQKALSSKEKQTTIINLCLFSFLIFAIAIGTSVMSILINYYLKDSAYRFYILIIKSIQLYTNILYEITYVKEMILVNNPIYKDNFFEHPKEMYYAHFAKLVYDYYLETSYIITNITNNLDTLPKKQEKELINKEINLFIIDPEASTNEIYQYKEYKVLVYSAYRELNSALYHISQLKYDKIFSYDDNVYYFIKNGMSNLIIESGEQIELLTDLFEHKTESGEIVTVICCIVNVILYVLSYIIFIHFYKKVEERKRSYLSVFYEINNNLIVLSLSKCEKFLHKLQLQENSLTGKGDKVTLDSTSIDDSLVDNDLQNSSLLKQNKERQTSLNNEEKNNNNNNYLMKSKILGFILFFLLLIWQLATYIYYYIRLVTYDDCIQYEYHTSSYASIYIFPFIGIREYIFDKENIFYGETINEYVGKTLNNFYVNLTSSSDSRDQYQSHFPNHFKHFLNDLYDKKICEFVQEFNQSYPENAVSNCSQFFFGTPDYGLLSVLAMYIEEIRIIRDKADELYKQANLKNYLYNESYFQDPKGNYEKFKTKYNNTPEQLADYEHSNPAKIFGTDEHKILLIVYRFIISNVLTLLINKSYETFEEMFEATDEVSLIINIIFIIVVSLGFFVIWLPFVYRENGTIFKTKNMLSIIPNEILINLPHINVMLGIDEQNNG